MHIGEGSTQANKDEHIQQASGRRDTCIHTGADLWARGKVRVVRPCEDGRIASCKIYEPWVSCSLGRVFLKFPRRMAKRKSEAPKPFSPITALKHNSTTAGPSFSPLKVSPAVRTQPDGAVGDVHLWHSVAVKGVNGARSLKKQPFL